MSVLNSRTKDSFWKRLGPKRQQMVVLVSAVVLVLLGASLVVTKEQPAQGKRKDPNALGNIITGANTRELGLSGLNQRIDDLTGQVTRLIKAQEDGRSSNKPSTAGTAATAAPVQPPGNDLSDLRKQNEDLRQKLLNMSAPPPLQQRTTSTMPAGTIGGVQQGLASQGQGQGAIPPPVPRIRTLDSDTEDKSRNGAAAAKTGNVTKDTSRQKEQAAYIPSGSMLSGVLITGLDAPTGKGSNGQPIPFLVRIKHEAILPNRYRADVRECFIVGAGYGDLSSERAYARAENLSCIRTDGKVIDTKVEMYAVGEDGKAGMRGHLISKQGQAIAKAAIAGFAQAYANSLQPNYATVYSPNSSGFSGQGIETGAYGGASSALDRIAKFEIDLANQMFPVVEIDAGRPVTFVAVKGSELALTTSR